MIDAVGAIHGSPLRGLPEPVGIGARRRRLLSQHVGFFKMNSSKQINSIRATLGQPIWQRNYYELSHPRQIVAGSYSSLHCQQRQELDGGCRES
jgi:hypothetical protein